MKLQEDLLGNMKEQLAKLQKKYLDGLDQLATLPNNLLKDAPGYYSIDALGQLYAIEAKIAVYQQQLGEKETDWCKIQRQLKLDAFKKQKTDAVSISLQNKQQTYSHLLASSLVIPKKFFIKRSAYYEEGDLRALSKIEEEIKYAYYHLEQTYDDWCGRERNQYLAKYKVKPSSIIAQTVLKIGVPAAVAVGALGMAASYVTSREAISEFEHAILQGEQKAAQGDYDEALQIFSQAANAYDGSFRSGHYAHIAREHMDIQIDKAVATCEELIQQGQLVSAHDLLTSLPHSLLHPNAKNAEKIKQARMNLTAAIDEGLDKILANLSAHKGHLDADTQQRLNDLLSINPNDYWLNFIKNKEK